MISSETIEAEVAADEDTAMNEETMNEETSKEKSLRAAAADVDSRDAELEDGEIEEVDQSSELAAASGLAGSTKGHSRTKGRRGDGAGAVAAGEHTSDSSSPSSDESDEKKKRRKRHKRKKRKDHEKEPRSKKKRRVHEGVGGDAVRPLSGGGIGGVADREAPLGPYDSSPPGPYDSPPPDSPRARGSAFARSSPLLPPPLQPGFYGDEDDGDEFGAAAPAPEATGRTLFSLIGSGLIDPSVAAHEKQDIFSRGSSREQLSPNAAKQKRPAKRKVRVGGGHPGAGAPKSRGPLLGPGGRLKSERPRCKFFMEGKCSKGEECTFSHNFVPPRKLEACKFFLQGCCSKGDSCLYLHNDVPCKFFHTGQKCRLESCRFSHSQLTDDMRPVLQKAVESVVEEQPPEPKKRPSLLGSPPQHIKDAAERMSEQQQQQRSIPSLFDIRVEPTAELACRLGERSGSQSPPRSQPSPCSSASSRAAADGLDAMAAPTQQSRSKPGGFYVDTLHSPPRPAARPPRPALLPTPVMYARSPSPPATALLPPLTQQQHRHAVQPPPPLSDPSDSNDEEETAVAASKMAPPSRLQLLPPPDASAAVPPSMSAGPAPAASAASTLPMHLPKTQRDLLLRLQKQQSQRVPDLSEVQQPPSDEDNWYSSDEEPAAAPISAAGSSGSSLHGSASGVGLASALPSNNILADILNSIALPQRGSLAPAALGGSASGPSAQPQSNTLAQMLMAIRSSQPTTSSGLTAGAMSETGQSRANASHGPSLGGSGLSLFSGVGSSSGSLLSLGGLHAAPAAAVLSASQSSVSLATSQRASTPEYRLVPITIDKPRQPWLPRGARTDPELQKDPRVERLLEVAARAEAELSPEEQQRSPEPAAAAAASDASGAAGHVTLPAMWLQSHKLLEQLPGLNMAALAAVVAKSSPAVASAVAAETRGWTSPSRAPAGDGGGAFAARELLATGASSVSSLGDLRLAGAAASAQEARSSQQQQPPTDPRQRLADPRVRPSDPRAGKPAAVPESVGQQQQQAASAGRSQPLADPRTVDPRAASYGAAAAAAAAAIELRAPSLGDPRSHAPDHARVLAEHRVAADSRMPVAADPRLALRLQSSDELGGFAPTSDPRAFAGSFAGPEELRRADPHSTLLHDPRSAHSNGAAHGRGGSGGFLRAEPAQPPYYEPHGSQAGKPRRGGLIGAGRAATRHPGVLPRPPPGVGLLPTPLTPPLADSRSADSVAESVAAAAIEPDSQQQQQHAWSATVAAESSAAAAELEPSRPQQLVAPAQLRGEGDGRKIGTRKSSMEYSSPLGGDGDSDRLDQGFNSYNRPRNPAPRTSASRAALTEPASSSSSSNGGARGGSTVEVHRQAAGGDPTPAAAAFGFEQPPVYEVLSLKEKFKAFDPTASPFS